MKNKTLLVLKIEPQIIAKRVEFTHFFLVLIRLITNYFYIVNDNILIGVTLTFTNKISRIFVNNGIFNNNIHTTNVNNTANATANSESTIRAIFNNYSRNATVFNNNDVNNTTANIKSNGIVITIKHNNITIINDNHIIYNGVNHIFSSNITTSR